MISTSFLLTFALTQTLLAPVALHLQETIDAGGVPCSAYKALIFVHGFRGSEHAWDDWRALLQKEPSISCLKVYTLSYETGLEREQPGIEDIAKEFRAQLLLQTKDAQGLFFVSHSMGGLIRD